MRLDEEGVRVRGDQRVELHQMRGHLEEPLPPGAGMALGALVAVVLHHTMMELVRLARAARRQPALVLRNVVPGGEHPGIEGEPQERHVLFRLVHVDVVGPGEGIDDPRRLEDVGRERAARIVGRPCYPGVITVRDHRFDILERPDRPETPVPRHEAVEVGRPRAVDADDEDGLGDLLAADLGDPPPLVGEFRIVAQDPAQVEGDVADPGLRQTGLRRLERLDQPAQSLEHPLRVGGLEGEAAVVHVPPRLPEQVLELQAALRNRVGPFVFVFPDPAVAADVARERAGPPDGARGVLADRTVADRERRHRIDSLQPVAAEVVIEGPVAGEGRGVTPRPAGLLEGPVGDLPVVESEFLDADVPVGRGRVAAVVDREPAPGIERDLGADAAQGVDRVVVGLEYEPPGDQARVHDRREEALRDGVGLRVSGGGHAGLRQPEDRGRETGCVGEEDGLFGDQLAPRIPHEPEGERPLHAGEVRLHLVADAALPVLVREGAEVLGEDPHRRNEEEVLVADAEAELQHVSEAEHVVPADRGVACREVQGGRQVVDRVDLL